MTGKNALTPARNAGLTDFPDDDAIARSKRILAMVDTYHERPDRMNRNALRGALMDEFTELLKGRATRDAAPPANTSAGNIPATDEVAITHPVATAENAETIMYGLLHAFVEIAGSFPSCEVEDVLSDQVRIYLAALPANASAGTARPSDLAIQMYVERHMATETEAKAFFAAPASDAHDPAIVETTAAPMTEQAKAFNDQYHKVKPDDTRKAILEEAALVCRARITGTRRTADHEAAECMNAIRAMYLPAKQPKEIEDWS